MSSFAQFKQKLANRENILGTGIMHSTYSGILELYKDTDLDFVLFDCEHGALNDINIEPMLRVCRLLDLPSIVRVPGKHQAFYARPLDMGADGIMVPRVDTLEELDEAVKHFRFAPRGYKGFGGLAQIKKGESLEEVNDNRILSIQIESRQGAQNLDAMLTKHGNEIGFVLIGPFDLSVDVGTPGRIMTPEELTVVDSVAETCAKHNKSLGMFCGHRDLMEFWKGHGVNLFWVTAELYLLMEEINRVCEAFKAL